jgi:hypothetical protein
MNELIERIKILASVEGDADDEILQLHIENSINAIYVYLNNPKLSNEDIIENYPSAIIHLAKRQYVAEKEHLTGVSSMSQGSRSISYASAISFPYSIDDTIKALLPRPFLRLY